MRRAGGRSPPRCCTNGITAWLPFEACESRFKGLTADIEAAGLPEPQCPLRQQVIGRSTSLAKARHL